MIYNTTKGEETMNYFHDEKTGSYHPITQTPSDGMSYTVGSYYHMGDLVLPYLGKFPSETEVKNHYEFGIALIDDHKNPIHIISGIWQNDPINQRRCSDQNIAMGDYGNELSQDLTPDMVIDRYLEAWDAGRNLATKIKIDSGTGGDLYIPKQREEDSPLERILKLMIISMRVVSSEQRKKLSDDYEYDNMVSSLDGATKHMSIIKFLEWTKLLDLKWEFSVFDLDDAPYPLERMLTITNEDDGWVDIIPPEDKEYFVVPLLEGEDPFKRIIKLALYYKMVPTSIYRKKGSTPHQINNMKSALRSKQKMTSDYFAIWCELLSMGSSFTLTNQQGIWYKAVGYEITTNYREEGTTDGRSGTD